MAEEIQWDALLCTCRKCGWTWQRRVAQPAECPRCKSQKWDEPRKRALKQNPINADALDLKDAEFSR